MNKRLPSAVIATVVAVIAGSAFCLTACALGLEPASNAETRTSIAFTLPALPGSDLQAASGRAIVQGNGFLYIQTGMTAADGIVHGPFPAVPGVPVIVTSIPAGSYPYFALIYVKNPDSNAHTDPILPSVLTSDGFLAALQALWSSDTDTKCTSSFSFLTNVAIRLNQVNTISASLIPTTDLVVSSSANLNGTPGMVMKRFVKMTGLSSSFTASGYTTMVCGASFMSTDTVTLYKVGLYDSGGRLLFWDATPRVMSMYPSQQTFTSPWTGDDSYYMYFEFMYGSTGLYLTFTGSP